MKLQRPSQPRTCLRLGTKTSAMVIALLGIAANSLAQDKPSAATVKFGAFVDTYFAHDFNRPGPQDRTYTTQPLRHSEMNVNMAYVEAVYDLEKVRGRFALQAGTSVLANYSGEPSTTAGQGLIQRHIQEAYAGYRVSDRLTIDAGIFLSHIGLESFISKDNWTYTRSLLADYSPYYQAGVRVSYAASEKLAAQINILNGWQNIAETNEDKALGLQLAYTPNSDWSIVYNNFVGYVNSQRIYHDLILKWNVSERFQIAGALDYGQQKQGDNSYKDWHGFSLIGRQKLGDTTYVALRVERLRDPNMLNVGASSIPLFAPTTNGFQVDGASVTVDCHLSSQLMWRNEIRGLWSLDPIFPMENDVSQRTVFYVSSLGLTF